MKKLFIKIFIFSYILFFSNITNAYELILPNSNNNNFETTNNYIHFIGNTKNNEILTINDKLIIPARNGAFATSFPLKKGKNRIIVRSNYNTKIYKIQKCTQKQKEKNVFRKLEQNFAIVKKSNTPLRSSPVDFGMNRLSHLFENTKLIIDGEQGNFYRVLLSNNNYGWINKNDIEFINNLQFPTPEFINMNSQNFKNAKIQTIKFSDTLPYTIEEEENEIILKVFNPFYLTDTFYTLNIPKKKKYTYKITHNKGEYSLKVSHLPTEFNNLNIVIDAGHGGSEKGAIGCLGDEEKNINLRIALETANLLKQKGLNVFLTREIDAFVSLQDRIDFAQKNNANIFISIHLNSISDVKFDQFKHKGTTTFYYNENSKNFASVLNKFVTHHAKTKNNNIEQASFAVIRPTDYIGVLLECAFMINPSDTLLYTSENFSQKIAQGIFEAIAKYVNDCN